MDHKGRQTRLRTSLEASRLDGILVTHLPNVRYLCGFTGSAGVLAIVVAKRGSKAIFFTDGRYTDQAKEQVRGATIRISKRPAMVEAAAWLVKERCKRLGIESQHMTVASRDTLAAFTRAKIKLVSTREIVESLRMLKEPEEIGQIRAAVLLASQVFETVVHDIKAGVPESSIAAEIEYLCRRMGAEGMSFDTLVSAGLRSALPHGVASAAPIPAKGFVILDFGVILGGYCSDMTRTVHVGAPSDKHRKMYAAVLEAQLAGIEAVRPGVKASAVDSAARKVLEKAGLGRYFTHSTGHGVGLEIHEPPGLRKMVATGGRQRSATADVTLKPGMVITIEPGVYISGVGGVRIEDMVLVTEQGSDVLTPTRKELILL
ncbi:MAG TPA: Xaa-Pro peptidase family protein [Terriglobales bacterium]|nr:Xaa-Pro peptidase family protein [Terriglobales bacterium]